MKRIFTHLEVLPDVSGAALSARVVSQMPEAGRALPFTASDGTVVTVVGSGRPYIGNVAGKFTVGLRGHQCPVQLLNEPVRAMFASRPEMLQAARRSRAAVTELRAVLSRGTPAAMAVC